MKEEIRFVWQKWRGERNVRGWPFWVKMSDDKFDWALAAKLRQSTAKCGHADDDSVMLEWCGRKDERPQAHRQQSTSAKRGADRRNGLLCAWNPTSAPRTTRSTW
eukprot:9667068-Heterocapsa_arctica.AAC.1